MNCFGPFTRRQSLASWGGGAAESKFSRFLNHRPSLVQPTDFFPQSHPLLLPVLKEVRRSSSCFVIPQQVFHYVKTNYNSEKNNSMCEMVK